MSEGKDVIISDDYVESATALFVKYAEIYQDTLDQMIKVFETDVQTAYKGETADALMAFKQELDKLKDIGALGEYAGRTSVLFLSRMDEIDGYIY